MTARTWTFPVLYEDDFVLAVNKPAGLSTQATHDPRRPNLYSLLQEGRKERLFLHHRLDKDTSGVLLLGRHPRANKGLTDAFRDHTIQKTYWALAKKKDPSESDWTAENHLAPVRGEGKKLMRMVSVKSGGWKAKTDFHLLAEMEQGDLWEAKPQTGRTHQIRVHLAGAKRPILGDALYGGKSSMVPRMMLHAAELRIGHPVSGENLQIIAPAPPDFAALLKKWGAPERFWS